MTKEVMCFLIVWKTLIIALAFITAGSPWVKNEEKLHPEPEIEVVEQYIEPTPYTAPAPAIEYTESDDSVVAENTTTVAENATVEDVGSSEQLDGEWTHSAVCCITHYCHGACCNGSFAYKPTASGAWPEAGRTVAVDRSVIPLGSEVLINGHIYIAEDTGVEGYWVDIFCDSHTEALNRGLYYTEVYWR